MKRARYDGASGGYGDGYQQYPMGKDPAVELAEQAMALCPGPNAADDAVDLVIRSMGVLRSWAKGLPATITTPDRPAMAAHGHSGYGGGPAAYPGRVAPRGGGGGGYAGHSGGHSGRGRQSAARSGSVIDFSHWTQKLHPQTIVGYQGDWGRYLRDFGDPGVNDRGPVKAGVNGNWECDGCQNVNFARRQACHKCRSPMSQEAQQVVEEYVRRIFTQRVSELKSTNQSHLLSP